MTSFSRSQAQQEMFVLLCNLVTASFNDRFFDTASGLLDQ